jgi:tetratricopeptide (TPR) repeat protein
VGAGLCEADSVRTGRLSRAAVRLANDAVLRLDADTTIRLADVATEGTGRSVLELVFGAFQSFSRKPLGIDVNAPHMALAIRGTEFVVRADANESVLSVQEGLVLVKNVQGELSVPGGSSAVARLGEAPQAYTLVRPEDAAQWALHYPPILATGADASSQELAPAMQLARTGDTAGALAMLDRLPGAADSAAVQLRRAALLLDVGQVDAAREAIDRSLTLDQGSGLAFALRATIDVAQNRRDEALANARRAVELSPGAAAPMIALSYARQASFDVAGARDTLLAATAAQPNDALAWARLAELQLMLGRRDLAREAAQRAADLAPDLARVQTVLGFANLTEFRTGPAKVVFERATTLDSADPLPRFGLGLAQIRDGDLKTGRGNLEAAIGLDPSNALLRTYLGKAYFEERRADIAGQQLGIASDLDPLDPTPHLYEAIRLQTLNRPVEALDSLERSIELNNNRSVYRSPLLLSEDRAARGASLSRVYTDLGFVDRGVREASRSVTYDPTNAAAHRFLSDIYGGVRRREISRVSELLQAQLLQDINVNPIQPALAETNLNIVTGGGPATPGYNEFTPLFERNQVQVNGTGVVGSNDTLGGEAVATAIHGPFSISAGLFNFESDGFRTNADIEHTLGNVFFQAAVTPELNAQLEFRHRSTRHGDLDMIWDPDDFSLKEERDLDQDSFRVGMRYSPTPNSDFLISLIYTDTEDKTFDSQDFGLGPEDIRTEADEQGYQAEVQYILRQDWYSMIVGGAFNYVDGAEIFNVSQDGFTTFEDSGSSDVQQPHSYIYGNINLPASVTWTLGLSYDKYEQDVIETEKVNPKLGTQWAVTNDLTLRAAAFQVVKPGLSTNRTIEPTQVAGFNQFFDDASGTAASRYGVGFDWRLADRLFVGGEATWRDVSIQYLVGEEDRRHTSWDEQTHSVYAHWAPWKNVAFTAQLVYDRFEAEESELTDFSVVPEDMTTISVPVGVNFFHDSGLFAGITTTYVDQDLERSDGNVLDYGQGRSGFGLVDLRLGYRFPKRRGIVTFQVNNLLDKEFNYQDNSFREFQDAPSAGPYLPDRQALLYLTLNW